MKSTGDPRLTETRARRIAQHINEVTDDRAAYPHRVSDGGWEVHVFWLIDREIELCNEQEADAYVDAYLGAARGEV